jgi:hypothetical protein
MDEQLAKIPTIEQITIIIQGQVTSIVQEQVAAVLQTQLANAAVSFTGDRSSDQQSYAEVARTPLISLPSNLRSISANSTPSAVTDSLYCTVDTSRVESGEQSKANPGMVRKAIETEMKSAERQEHWRSVAVTKDPKNAERIRVTCRTESELARVKEVAQKTSQPETRVLRDQLYPVKVDNTNRTAILTSTGDLQPEATEKLGKENEVEIAKLVWLSKKDSGKAYCSE